MKNYILQNDLRTEKIENTLNERKILTPLDFIFNSNCQLSIHSHINFICDGASIPRLAQPIFGGHWDNKYIRFAVMHDYLYFYNGIVPVYNWLIDEYVENEYFHLSREVVDRFFYLGLVQVKVNYIRRRIMYRSVQCGGLVAWEFREEQWNEILHPYKNPEGIIRRVFIDRNDEVCIGDSLFS